MITIEAVSAQQFGALPDRLAAKHKATVAPLSANTGTITGHGVSASYIYDPVISRLTVDVGPRPWYITEDAIESNLRDALL